ncbi:MAG: NAD-dependent epimerase/dehydratase family protein [Clostridia bacterium]|nr:NAD-dependent epimerase/dehydratase family protein [Clostridia bacterium]
MRILITGKGSYIGTNIKSYLESFGHTAYEVDTVSDEWRNADFSRYDSVIHVAAIVHQNAKDASDELFNAVNTELPVKIARLAKESGVSQFVFLSTMGVYGVGKTLSASDSVIKSDTPLNAVGGYGGSKLEAEKQLRALEDDTFRLAIVRPPNVYGPGCGGNYIPLFRKLALMQFICPYAFTEIRQSMLYIDNLSELVRLIVENSSSGVFLPQDDVAPNTVEMIHTIRSVFRKKTHDSGFLGWFVKVFRRLSIIQKIYGGVMYDTAVSGCFDNKYQIVSFKQGMQKTFCGQPTVKKPQESE